MVTYRYRYKQHTSLCGVCRSKALHYCGNLSDTSLPSAFSVYSYLGIKCTPHSLNNSEVAGKQFSIRDRALEEDSEQKYKNL
jgi:hypothetical protein